MPVTRVGVSSYFSPLAMYCGDGYVPPDVADIRSTADDCGSAACTICGQKSDDDECAGAGWSFSSAPTAVGTPEALVIPTTPEMPFPMESDADVVGSGKKMVTWSSYKEELDSSNSSSFELMPTENDSEGTGARCVSPVRNLVLDGTGSNYVVPAVLSLVSSAGEKVESEPWDGDAYLYAGIIPGTFGAAMSYALWYKRVNGDCSCQECKKWCRYWWGKVMERGWNCLMWDTTAR